jgi:mRNA-degrading endonuclease HigB of HigAB toxin-antitoxin module
MAMQAGTFFTHFKQIKAFIEKHPDASDELKAACSSINDAFKKSFTPEAFKQALADNAIIDTNLEDITTSATILMSKDRTRLGG